MRLPNQFFRQLQLLVITASIVFGILKPCNNKHRFKLYFLCTIARSDLGHCPGNLTNVSYSDIILVAVSACASYADRSQDAEDRGNKVKKSRLKL